MLLLKQHDFKQRPQHLGVYPVQRCSYPLRAGQWRRRRCTLWKGILVSWKSRAWGLDQTTHQGVPSLWASQAYHVAQLEDDHSGHLREPREAYLRKEASAEWGPEPTSVWTAGRRRPARLEGIHHPREVTAYHQWSSLRQPGKQHEGTWGCQFTESPLRHLQLPVPYLNARKRPLRLSQSGTGGF